MLGHIRLENRGVRIKAMRSLCADLRIEFQLWRVWGDHTALGYKARFAPALAKTGSGSGAVVP